MIVNYVYKSENKEEYIGPYDCEKEDFVKFFERKPKGVYWIRVIIPQVFNPHEEWYHYYKSYVWMKGRGWDMGVNTDYDNYAYVRDVQIFKSKV